MSKFEGITDNELTAEINRRRQEAEEKARKSRAEKNTKVASIVRRGGEEFVNLVAPKHVKQGCNDESHWNDQNCARCLFLEIVRNGEWYTVTDDIELDIDCSVVHF